MGEKEKNPRKVLLIVVGLIALIALHAAVMFTDKVVDVTEKREVPIEFQAYAPDLPEKTDVEQVLTCTGGPVYALSSKQYTLRGGSIRSKQNIDSHYMFIPCQTESGVPVWIGGDQVVNTSVNLDATGTLLDFWASLRALIPEDGSAFTVRGMVIALNPEETLALDSSYYSPLAAMPSQAMQSREDYDALQTALADVTAAGRYLSVFVDNHDTRMVDVVVGQETKREVSKAFLYLLLADVVAGIWLLRRRARRARKANG